ncbi:6-phosphogluconate dehydrogenase protein [Rutstroemia sp. NJR-2017a BBW]|nr:6-phosphogluconate dehydrogenase protein [Rutstroemia sp. NJR-2017a BBW]
MAPLATVGILSIGEMGMGVAKLLIAHGYRVVTNIEGRSEDTHQRALKSSIECLPTDESLVSESDYIFSIVPPRDAFAIATRITTALKNLSPEKSSDLYYLDLNAIAPSTARSIYAHFQAETPEVKFIDGGIIGGAPALKSSSAASTTVSIPSSSTTSSWTLPLIPLSGPHPLSDTHLASLLNTNYLGKAVGQASGLKCCFASMTKGFTALCIQAFTTAEKMGVRGELEKVMGERVPGLWGMAGRGVGGMAPKAYRWVGEMREIGGCFGEEGGWEGWGGEEGNGEENGKGKGVQGIFAEVAEVYRIVADETILGEEKPEKRKRGLTIEDVAICVGEGLDGMKEKKTKRAKTE